MADCLIGLGSNIGDRAAQLDQATQRICEHPGITLQGTSRYYETAPVGGPADQDSFLNAAIRITTSLPPEHLFARIREVEHELGRQRLERWGPRSIDLDLLLYDQLIQQTPHLVLPHPRMAIRRFVLEPACEVAAELIHGPTGWSIQHLLARLDRTPCYVAVCCADASKSRALVTTVARDLPVTPVTATAPPTAAPSCEATAADDTAVAALAEQSSALATITTSELPQQHCFVSNFWLNQSLALARTWPACRASAALQQACMAAIERAPQPHFILHLELAPSGDSPSTEIPQPHSASLDAEHSTGQTTLESFATQLRVQLALPGQGPTLHVPAANMAAASIELRAGIDAMR